MKVFAHSADLRSFLDGCDASQVGFVPTMGALHSGHLSLVGQCQQVCGVTVVSLFVNPTQFNDPNDLRDYPRTEEEDLRKLGEAGVDAVFMPAAEEIYPEPDTRVFDFGSVDKVMEGASRPGHFNGVAQVVSRLFDIVRPAKALFGEKDFQQIAVIKAMIVQLGYNIEIVECPIVRDTDGLALSSRNTLLDTETRAAAPHIYATLKKAAAMKADKTPAEVEKWVVDEIDHNPRLRAIYFQIVDPLSLQKVGSWIPKARGCIAVQAGKVRLIDNIEF